MLFSTSESLHKADPHEAEIPLTKKMNRVLVLSIVLILVIYVLYQGWVISPRLFIRYIKGKKTYVTTPLPTKQITGTPLPATHWSVTLPNVTLYVIVNGGIGNTLLSYAAAVEACREKGLRLPILITESAGQFDYHRVPVSQYGLEIGSISEILPSANLISMHSQFSCFTTFEDKTVWKADSLETLELHQSVVQLTQFKGMLAVSPESFDFVRRSINNEIAAYIKTHYGLDEDDTSTMGIHLRMGQPTDEYAPPRPDVDDITAHYQKYTPSRVMIFTDNRSRAETFMTGCEIPNVEWVGETAPVEFVMMGMCSTAVISHSTLSCVASRVFNRKDITMAVSNVSPDFSNIFDPSWNIVFKDVNYRTKV